MKYLKQFGIILFISLLGEALHALLPLPVPASIYGIVLLFIGLCTKIIPLSAVEETGKFLIEIMPIMFIPAAVGLINVWGVIKNVWVSYLVVTVASTAIVMGISGVVTQLVVRHSKGGTVIVPAAQTDDGIVLDESYRDDTGVDIRGAETEDTLMNGAGGAATRAKTGGTAMNKIPDRSKEGGR